MIEFKKFLKNAGSPKETLTEEDLLAKSIIKNVDEALELLNRSLPYNTIKVAKDAGVQAIKALAKYRKIVLDNKFPDFD